MTTYSDTPADAPRIPVGTRVRYTERGNDLTGKWYRGLADGEGEVAEDDGSGEAPYLIVLDNEYPNPLLPIISADSVLADHNELEILS